MRLRPTAVMVVLGVVAAGCGSGAGVTVTNTTLVETTTTSPHATTTTSTATSTTHLRGDPVDFGPPEGAELGVVGVAYDDVLNLRAAPGADQSVLLGIPPTYDRLLAVGQTRTLPAFWTRVEYEGDDGWVNMRYLAYLGATSDVTSRVIAAMGGRPEEATMIELGTLVAMVLSSEDPPSIVTQVVESSVGDVGEVTFDIIGLGDDSLRGLRLRIFGEVSVGGFTLRTVEQTVLCDPARGVDPDGVCA